MKTYYNYKQLRPPILIMAFVLCVLYILLIMPAAATQKESSADSPQKPDSVAEPEKSESEESRPADPNSTSNNDEEKGGENDIFGLKISTYLMINKAFSRIFTPELVTENGLVSYSTLKRKRLDIIEIKRELKNLNPAILMNLSKEERIAFWINTYNFCTINLILDNYPIQPKWYMVIYPDNSIMQIPGAWEKVFHEIQREEYTLKEIEQDFLLDRYKDPRICFALSNATIGGPPLRNEPYKAEQLDEQLDDQIKKYLSTDKGMRWDRNNKALFLSNIFQTYKKAFLESDWAKIKKFRDRTTEDRIWLNFILPYLSEDDVRYLEDEDVRIKFIDFDWHLNEAP